MNVTIEPTWKAFLEKEFEKQYFKELSSFVHTEYAKRTTYPQPKDIFRAFNLCPFNEVKVVILGQDPYHGKNQANGLCFAVHEDIPLPPSLKNIYKEIKNDLGYDPLPQGDLSRWATQGVLLLNSTLTVSASLPGSHQGRGWEEFTDAVIHTLSEKRRNLVFILWGAYAKKKGAVIDRTRHLVLESPHPSPFSANNGFFGSRPFSKTNEYLEKNGLSSIDWK